MVYELNFEGAKLARVLCDEFTAANPAKPRFVAGVLGPTSRTASISPDVNDPGYRNVTFDELVGNYIEAITGLVEGGADILSRRNRVRYAERQGRAVRHRNLLRPGRPPLAGDDLGHHYRRFRPHAVRPDRRSLLEFAEPYPALSFGLNCALGAKELRQYVEELSRVCDCYVSAHPNAGLPNAFGGYDETAEMLADEIESWAKTGIVNIVGGCCGTSPEHIAAIAQRVAAVNPRQVPKIEKKLRLSRAGAVQRRRRFALRERRRADQCHRLEGQFARMILEGRFDDALAVARQQVENGAQVIDINMDEAMLDSLAAMDKFLKLIASEPDISRVPIMIDSSKWSVIEAGLKCIQGKGDRQFDLDEGRRSQASSKAGQAGPPLRRRRDRHGLRRKGPGRHLRPQDRDFQARLRPAD